ncbi:ribonuclease HII [Pseudalgibacter alginicilyticus]|uniref:Ribonuclease HII n=1 Tax=Pseudalgibacter alginicilyticus TaxID=1736674 RepID=A0A0P0CZK6_9FLAO|nr:hypothetical protein [Pseudalgibacter alginicilyticus]ALJ06088.1 ribonuclease HII [Pseudalgibacter alginicilyticus]
MKFFYSSLLLFLILSCSKSKHERSKLIHFAPENASLILKTNNLEGLKSSLDNNDFIEGISKSVAFTNFNENLELLKYLKPTSETLICFSENDSDSLEYTIITKYSKELFETDSLPNYIAETLTYKNRSINKSTINKHVFYSIVLDSTFIASTSKLFIENSFNTKPLNTNLEKIYSTTNSDKTASIILKANKNTFLKSFFINDTLLFKTFTNYLAIDTDISQNEIIINGITKDSDSTKSLINIFKNTIPQENQTQNVTPPDSDGFMSFTFNNFKIFKKNLIKFNKKDSLISATTLFDNIIEIGVIYKDNDKAIALNSLDVIGTHDALLSEQNNIETYRQVDIFGFSTPNLFAETLSPFITSNTFEYYCVLDNFFVYSNSINMLQQIIANYQNKTTLSQQPYFLDIKEQLSDQASLMLVTNPSALQTILNHNIDNLSKLKLEAYKTSSLQFIYDNHFAHVNGIIKKNKVKASLHSISEEFNIKLENDLLNTPQLATNHINKQKEIIIQDVNNNLYLISNTGKILWKKQLHGPVLGKIEQIDIYKNGRLQLVFATPNRVYVLDRNGKDVAPFPSKFNDKITQPLSVFDYDKNKNYRLLVTQGSNILMYDVSAKIVRGFTFKNANNTIISQPQHFRMGNKDYIGFKTENKLYLLDRTGKTRITPKTNYNYSSEAIYLYNNKFTTTTKTGDLISIDTRGNVASVNLNLAEHHHLETTSKTLVTLSENKLTIKSKTIELDYGNYTKPQIFYIYDKIYVSTTDLQSQKTFLFDSQAEMIQNFPVYGNSIIYLDNIDRDRDLEFVVKGESNSILLYQIN